MDMNVFFRNVNPEPNVDKRYKKLKIEHLRNKEALELNEAKEKSLRMRFLRKSLDTYERRRLVDEWDATDRTISVIKQRLRNTGDQLTQIENEAIAQNEIAEDNHPTRS